MPERTDLSEDQQRVLSALAAAEPAAGALRAEEVAREADLDLDRTRRALRELVSEDLALVRELDRSPSVEPRYELADEGS
jgi:DNA-binding IclR family transcriptional regulator